MNRFMAVLACVLLACLVCLWWLPTAPAQPLGDCTVAYDTLEESRCMNTAYCFTGSQCQPCNNTIYCNGMYCSYCKFLSGVKIGICGTVMYSSTCTYCPGDMVCATGEAYGDVMCMEFCCDMVRRSGPNKCAQ